MIKKIVKYLFAIIFAGLSTSSTINLITVDEGGANNTYQNCVIANRI